MGGGQHLMSGPHLADRAIVRDGTAVQFKELRQLLKEAENRGDHETAERLKRQMSDLADRATVDRGGYR